MGHEEEEKRTLKKTQRMKSSKRNQNFEAQTKFLSQRRFAVVSLLVPITLALSLLARRLSSSCAAPRHSLIMITGARRGAAASGVENAAPHAEKLAKTMATKSIDDAAPASSANNNEFPPLRVKKLVPEALLPVRGSAGAAGYDLAR